MLLKPILAEQDPAQEILRSAGIGKNRDKNDLKEILTDNGLSLEETIQRLSELCESSDPTVKMRGIDTSLKLHKVMEDDTKAPQIVINIVPLTRETGSGIPSILLPREIEVA